MVRNIRISEICEYFHLKWYGRDVVINGLNLCNRKTNFNSILSYVTNQKYVENIIENKGISCLLVSENNWKKYEISTMGRNLTFVVSDEPERLFYDIHDFLVFETDFYDRYQFQAVVGKNCTIDDTVVIENGVRIGDGVKIGANTVIKRGTQIGNCCEIGCNTTIGSEGFQILRINNKNRKVMHVGGVSISDGVYIGDNTCICNSLFEGATYIGEETKIDNLVHIGHNLYIGNNVVITAHVILCGSAIIEDEAWIGPNSSILNRVVVGKGAKVGLGAVVTRNVRPYSLVYGSPAKEH